MHPIFTKFVVMVAHGLWKKPLDFGDNPDSSVRDRIRVGTGMWLGGGSDSCLM